MATRAEFDTVLTDLHDAIVVAKAFCGVGGPTITDQDIATLRNEVNAVKAFSGAPSGASLKFDQPVISPTTTGNVTLTVPTAATFDQVWNLSFSPDALTGPPVVTLLAGQTSVSFTVTAGSPPVDTFCTVKAAFNGQVAEASCTVLHA